MKLEDNSNDNMRKRFEPYIKSLFNRNEDYNTFIPFKLTYSQNGVHMIYNSEDDRGYIVGHGNSSLDSIQKEKENLQNTGYDVCLVNYESCHLAEFKKLGGEYNGDR